MYHRFRTLHRWIGAGVAVALLLISVTGFLLSTKKTVDWIRPLEREGAAIEALNEVVPVHLAAEAAFGLGLPELATRKDIDRIDYRPKSNVYKVLSKKGYHEVQVDGKSGKVLHHARRNDHFIEALHDFSWFADWTNLYALPVAALGLCFLAASGLGIFFVPVVRRWKFRKSRGSAKGSA